MPADADRRWPMQARWRVGAEAGIHAEMLPQRGAFQSSAAWRSMIA